MARGEPGRRGRGQPQGRTGQVRGLQGRGGHGDGHRGGHHDGHGDGHHDGHSDGHHDGHGGHGGRGSEPGFPTVGPGRQVLLLMASGGRPCSGKDGEFQDGPQVVRGPRGGRVARASRGLRTGPRCLPRRTRRLEQSWGGRPGRGLQCSGADSEVGGL